MNLTPFLAGQTVSAARNYLGRAFVYETFNCVHFVREVYQKVGIALPSLDRSGYPPPDFHLSAEELPGMPLGHSIFLKRKSSQANRFWTHVALIVSIDEVIHCSRHFGKAVTITPLEELWRVYALTPKPLI